MTTSASSTNREGRETRLLLVTIAISVGVLLLLARFRFPAEPADRPVESAPAPLERLAAEATYEELASIMADLERRIAPRVAVVRTTAPTGATSLVIAPRITPDRAVVFVHEGYRLNGLNEDTTLDIVAEDAANGVHVLRVPAVDDGAVAIRTGTPRLGPRYVGVVEATSQGPVLRPVYIGRMQLVADERTTSQQISMIAPQQMIPRGAAIFTLEGALIGLVRDTGETTTVLTGEYLRTAAAAAPPAVTRAGGWFGVELDPLTPQLTRATGADRGVIVAHVQAGGPAEKVLQPGDVVQSLKGVAVGTVGNFRQIEASSPPGATVAIAGIRQGSELTATLTSMNEVPVKVVPSVDGPGFIGRDVAGSGTEVLTVSPASPAAVAGLQPGDVIVAIDRRQAPLAGDIASRFTALKPGAALLLNVQRGRRHHILALEKR